MSRLSPFAREFLEKHPSDCARILEQLDIGTVRALVGSLQPELAAGLLERMVTPYGSECLSGLDIPVAAAIVQEMNMPRAARLLGGMSKNASAQILDTVPAHIKSGIGVALRYPERTVGRVMDSNPFCLPDKITVLDAIKRVKHLRERAVQEIFVVDDDQKLKGAVRIADLLSAGRSSSLEVIVVHDIPFLYTLSDISSAAQHKGWKIFAALPVVEKDHTLSGILKSSVLMHVLASDREAKESSDVLHEMYSMTKMYWIVMAEMMNEVIGREKKE